MGVLLIVIVLLLLAGSVPTWPHSRRWGYMPSSVLSIVLLILIVLMIFNVGPWGWGQTPIP